jgi:hypothetical protein
MRAKPFRFNPGSNTWPPLISATICPIQHRKNMKFIQFIANAFINTMGITQPSPQAANRAAWFIVILLSAVLVAVATIAIVAIHVASSHH